MIIKLPVSLNGFLIDNNQLKIYLENKGFTIHDCDIVESSEDL